MQLFNLKEWKSLLQKSIFWKLILVNGLVIGIAIWLAGFSVKEFACLLVQQQPLIGSEESRLFNETMHSFLLNASFLAVLVAGLIHYFFVRKLLFPLKSLSHAARLMAKGKYPEFLPVYTKDEMGQLTDDFNNLNQKLRQNEELRKKIMSDVAHELRTPLTNINGYLEALSTGMIEGNREIFESLHEESLRITRLVNQMHELNVWESRQLSHDSEWVSIEQVIKTILDSFALKFENKGIIVHAQVSPETLRCDQDGIKQVLINLLDNVLHYDLGGWVDIQGKAANGNYMVSVSNKGQAIPREKAEHLFDRFFRLDPSRNRETGGSGLGLALVKEIIEQHKGEVGLSIEGDTHTFWFKLPFE